MKRATLRPVSALDSIGCHALCVCVCLIWVSRAPPWQVSGLDSRQVCQGCSQGHLAAPGAVSMLSWKRPWGWWQGGSFPKLGGFRRGKDGKLMPFRVVSLMPLSSPQKPRWVLGESGEEPWEVRTGKKHRAGLVA